MNRSRIPGPRRINVGATLEQIIDHGDLPRHHSPMERLAAVLIGSMEEIRLLIDELTYAIYVTRFDRLHDLFCLGYDMMTVFQNPFYILGQFDEATIARNRAQ